MGGVTEAPALHVVVRHLGDALDPEWLPAQVLVGVPAARPARLLRRLVHVVGPISPRVAFEGVLAKGLELGGELDAPLVGEARGHADVVQRAARVVEPEQQRAHVGAGAVLVPAKARDDRVAGALVLDLEHRALARLVGAVSRLGHHTVEARALEAMKPVLCDGAVGRRGRQVDRRVHALQHRHEPRAPLDERERAQIFVADREDVPEHDRRGGLGREQLHARGRRVEPILKCLELERAAAGDHDLSIEHHALGERRAQRREQLREVARERLLVAALEEDLVAVAKHERAKAVPFRLEDPSVALGQRVGALRQHRLERGHHRELHGPMLRHQSCPRMPAIHAESAL